MSATVGSNLEEGWRWCGKCEGLFYGSSQTAGRCPGGGTHTYLRSGAYLLQNKTGVGQSGWLWCGKCEGLFYGAKATKGRCPAGGVHDGANNSGGYILPSILVGDAQPNWAHCRKCQGLFYQGNPTKGRCPAQGGHDGSGGATFTLHKQ